MNNSVEGENNDFSEQLSKYITSAVESLKEGRVGYHRMNIDNKHLLKCSEKSLLYSKHVVETSTNDSSEIASNFLDNQSLN